MWCHADTLNSGLTAWGSCGLKQNFCWLAVSPVGRFDLSACQFRIRLVDSLCTKRQHIRHVSDCLQALSKKYKISAMPTFIAFNKGEKVQTIVGADLKKMTAVIASCAFAQWSLLRLITSSVPLLHCDVHAAA